MKLRNISGYPLEIRDYGLVVGPGGEIDTDELGHDPERDGVITGFGAVDDEPEAEAKKPAAKKTAKSGDEGETK